MKDFDKLNELELANLTAEEIENYKNLYLAKKGIPIPIMPTKDIVPIVIPKKKYYEVQLPSYLAFENIEDANKLANYIKNLKSRGTLDYDYEVGYNNKYFRNGININYDGKEGEIGIATKDAYTYNDYNKIKPILVRNYKCETKYEEQLNKYREDSNRANACTAFIDEAIENAIDNLSSKKKYLDIFYSKYYPLNEDINVAMSYFKVVYDITDEQEEYIRKNITFTPVCA